MEWIKKHISNRELAKKSAKENKRKLFQTKVDRTLADDFKIMSAALGKTQRELIENFMSEQVFNFKRGKLQWKDLKIIYKSKIY